MKPATLILRDGKEKSLLRGHPWIFAGAIAAVHGDPGTGDTVEVRSREGPVLARAAFSPASQIRARVWTFDGDEAVDADFFARRIAAALTRRAPQAEGASRLVHGEADGLPGLIVDRYASWLVLQILAAGIERHRELIVSELMRQTGYTQIYERSDAEVRQLEGLEARVGSVQGELPSGSIEIVENGLYFAVDIVAGQKTGFYIDQSENRALLRQRVRGEVLNCFCYTGGFTMAALAGGASDVLSIDSSADAIAAGQASQRRNGFAQRTAHWLCGDVFTALRDMRNRGRQFDTVILDPPKFAPTAAHAERAARAYKDINLLALKLLRPGGELFTFSCSGGISPELFQKIIAGAAADAGATVLLRARLGAAADHPVALNFPEGDYLKGLLLEKTAALQARAFASRESPANSRAE